MDVGSVWVHQNPESVLCTWDILGEEVARRLGPCRRTTLRSVEGETVSLAAPPGRRPLCTEGWGRWLYLLHAAVGS